MSKMNTKPDEHYITQTLQGKVNAFGFLVEKYQHMVYTLVIRIVKNREEAEEVSQDVFVKAFEKLDKFKGDAKFSTWLYKIAYYASLDVIKRNKKIVHTENIEVFTENAIDNVGDGLNFLHEKERQQVLKDALSKLSPIEQTILNLYYFEEMPLNEVIQIVDLSLDNVKVKLYRSRKKLFSILEGVIEPRTIDLI